MVTEFVMGVNVQGMSLGWGKHSPRSTGTISQPPQGASPGGSVIFSINRERLGMTFANYNGQGPVLRPICEYDMQVI